MTPLPGANRLPPRPLALSGLVLAAGLAATAATAYYTERAARARDEIRFQAAVEHVATSIGNRVATYVALLRAGVGLFSASRRVEPEEFQRFIAQLNLPERYPGIQGIGFARRIGASALAETLVGLHSSGGGDLMVWPDDPRENYYPIVYLEPQDRRNRAALGYDMFTEPVRRAAMEAAARTGQPAASGQVTLVQEIDPVKQPGFLIYAAVYAPGAPAGDPSQVYGFIYSPFRAGDFLTSVFRTEGWPAVFVAVYDGERTIPEARLFDTAKAGLTGRPTGRLASTRTVSVAGRTWTLSVESLADFEAVGGARLWPWILLAGPVVSFLLAWATRREAKARAAAESAAERLRRSEEALRASETKLIQLVAAERRAHAEAAAASRAKDDFLATLSHELRTPLNAVLGWATMLKSGRLGPEQRERAIDVIARSAKAQADLIEDLLDVSRIVAGKLRLEPRPIDLSGPVQAALDAVRPAAEAKGLALTSRVSSDLLVSGDHRRLQQVASNLLSNAIKFTPGGGSIDVSLARRGDSAVVSVSDTGIGIQPSFRPYVFDRFRQQDGSATRMHGGMGLGLAIVRHLVASHGGTVRAESAGEGRGSTFTVTLPLQTAGAEPAPGPPDAQAADRVGPIADLAGLRALVVDDDEDSRTLMAETLSLAGAEVTTAGSAADAMARLEGGSFDVLLADISMPDTDGYSLMRAVRRHPSERVRTVPAIAVTAFARAHDRATAEAAGYQDHVPKPVDEAVLRLAIRRVVTAQPSRTAAE